MGAALSALLVGCAFSNAMYEAGVDVDCRDAGSTSSRDWIVARDGLSLTWVRAAGRRDQELGAAWCETVGPPVVVPAPDTRFTALSVEHTLTVVTWNMNVGGGDLLSFVGSELGLSCGGPTGPQRGADVQPFVLLLQEAYRRSEQLPVAAPSSAIPRAVDPERRPGADLDIVELAELCGLSLVYVPSNRNGPDSEARPREDKGNAILSSLPLAAPVAIDLPFETSRRVAVAAELRVGGRATIRVVSLHLDVTALPFRMLRTGNQNRARQASGLIEALSLLDRRQPEVSGTVVGADLNTWASKEGAAALMRRAFPQSPPWDGRPTRGVFPTDHVFFRSNMESPQVSDYRVLESSYRSDHHARVVLLRY